MFACVSFISFLDKMSNRNRKKKAKAAKRRALPPHPPAAAVPQHQQPGTVVSPATKLTVLLLCFQYKLYFNHPFLILMNIIFKYWRTKWTLSTRRCRPILPRPCLSTSRSRWPTPRPRLTISRTPWPSMLLMRPAPW